MSTKELNEFKSFSVKRHVYGVDNKWKCGSDLSCTNLNNYIFWESNKLIVWLDFTFASISLMSGLIIKINVKNREKKIFGFISNFHKCERITLSYVPY